MSPMGKLLIGIRKTRILQLAAVDLLKRIGEGFPNLDAEIIPIEAEPSASSEDSEEHIRELENALLEKQVDLVLHLLKEIPIALPERIELKAVTERMTPFDAFVSGGDHVFLDELPERASLGISHARQREQLSLFRPDLQFVMVRGSVDSRLQQMESRKLAGIILSAASLERLGLQDRVSEMIMGNILLPGPGQGCLGVLGLRASKKWDDLLGFLGDATSRLETTAERAFMARLTDSPAAPLAVLAAMDSAEIIVEGFLADSESGRSVRDSVRGPSRFAEELGNKLALELSLRMGEDGLAALQGDES